MQMNFVLEKYFCTVMEMKLKTVQKVFILTIGIAVAILCMVMVLQVHF